MTIAKEGRATLLIVGAAVLWGLIGPFSVWVAREGLTASQTAFWRTAGTVLPFAFIARREFMHIPRRALVEIGLFGVFGIAVMYVAFFISVERTGVGIAAVLLYTGPAWVALFEWLTTRRAPPARSLLALAVTVVGVLLVSYLPGQIDRVDRTGAVAGLISGVAYATHFTLGRRLFQRHHPSVVFALAMTAAALAIAPLARPDWPPSGAIPPLLFLSLIATFAASLLFARGVVQVAPVRAAVSATIEPVVALLASVLVLQATLQLQQLAGAGLVLGGVTMIMLQRQPRD